MFLLERIRKIQLIINLLTVLVPITFVNQSCKNIKYPNNTSLYNDKIKAIDESKVKARKTLIKKVKSSKSNLIPSGNIKTTKIAQKPTVNSLQNTLCQRYFKVPDKSYSSKNLENSSLVTSISKPKNNNTTSSIKQHYETRDKTSIDNLSKLATPVNNDTKKTYNTNLPTSKISLNKINGTKVKNNKKIFLEVKKESGSNFTAKKSKLTTIKRSKLIRIPIPYNKSSYTKTFKLKNQSNVNKRNKKQRHLKVDEKQNEDKDEFIKQGRIHPRKSYKIALVTLIGVAAFGVAATLTVLFALPFWGFLFTIAGVATFGSVNIAAASHYYRCCKSIESVDKEDTKKKVAYTHSK